MRRGVCSAGDGGADPDKPEELLDRGNGVQTAVCTEAVGGSNCAEGRANDYDANDYAEATVSDCTTAANSDCATTANSDCATATGSNYAEAVDEYGYAAGNECAVKWVADDCTGTVVCTCTDAGHVYL
jgi:hypothetical protein